MNEILPPSLYGGDLQLIVDQLYKETYQPVVLTDPEMNVMSASRHDRIIDRNRNAAILKRRTPIQSRRFARQHSIDRGQEPVHIPPCPGIGMDLARWCFRLNTSASPLGFLWMLAPRDATGGQPPAVAPGYCHRIEQLLLRAAAHYVDIERAEDKCVSALVSGGALGEGCLDSRAAVGRCLPQEFEVSVLRPVEQNGVSEACREGVLIHLARRGVWGACLLDTVDGDIVAIRDHAYRDQLDAGLVALTEGRPRWRIGTSDTSNDLQTLPELTRQAQFAADLACLPEYDGWASWHQLGSWVMLYGLPQTSATVEALCPGMSTLVADSHKMLAQTALAYLEESCSAEASARRLSIHRTTLYYRLRSVDAILGAGWLRGWRRAGVHAALNMSRLLVSSGQSS